MNRDVLTIARKKLDAASLALAQINASIGRAEIKRAANDIERQELTVAEDAETERVIAALQEGGDPDKALQDDLLYETRLRLAASERSLATAFEVLEERQREASTALKCAENDLDAAINFTVADHLEGPLAKACALDAEMRKLLPILNAGLAYDVPGLRDFVCRQAAGTSHQLNSIDPKLQLAQASLRAWKAALAEDPAAQFSEEAGATLLAAERARREAEEARIRAEEEKFRAEMRAEAEERGRPQREANEKWERENQVDPTIRNRIPQAFQAPLDPCHSVLISSSVEGNKF